MSKIRTNPFFPSDPTQLANSLGVYWRELATKVNSVESVVTGNADNEIGGLSIGLVYSQAEVQALRDKCEELADDVRAIKTALENLGLIG